MRHAFQVRIGPASFRIGSDWRAPVAALAELYRDYPMPDVPDFTVRLEAPRFWRRWVRPSVAIAGDYMLPEAALLPLRHGLLATNYTMLGEAGLAALARLVRDVPALAIDYPDSATALAMVDELWR